MKKTLLFILSLIFFAFSLCSCTQTAAPETKVNSKNFAAFQDDKTGLWGYKDKEGNTVIDCQFDSAGEFHNDRAPVWKNNRGGYIDGNGNLVIDYIYKETGNFSNGRAVVRKDDKYGYIDTNGNAVTEFIYDNATEFNTNGQATVISKGKQLTIDKEGKEVIPDPTASPDTEK